MNLKALVERGFSTARLCQGGSETAQCPKWLAKRAQQVLLAKMRELYMSTVGVDADENLSEQGRARKKAELAKAALASIEESLGTVRNSLASKRKTAQQRLAEAGKPEGQSDIDRLARLMEVQGMRQLLLGLGGQELLGELIRSSREGDTTTFDAITGLPAFILRDKGIARETIDAARRELFNKLDPLAVSAAEDAETMARLVDENVSEAQRAIREFCGVPEERSVRVYK
jgi:hypothetical protein